MSCGEWWLSCGGATPRRLTTRHAPVKAAEGGVDEKVGGLVVGEVSEKVHQVVGPHAQDACSRHLFQVRLGDGVVCEVWWCM